LKLYKKNKILFYIKMKNKRDKKNVDFVKDGYTNTRLLEIIKEIREKYNIENIDNIGDDDKKDFETNYKFFIERYPFLSDMSLKKDINMDTLYYMLDLREKIINNTMTFEDASKKVGNDMYKEYN
tara:strand:- start:2091 stop:2465 length:375 start_codon:yes stop_codon:yes gene_type:complete